MRVPFVEMEALSQAQRLQPLGFGAPMRDTVPSQRASPERGRP